MRYDWYDPRRPETAYAYIKVIDDMENSVVETTVTLMGIPINIRYEIHENGYIEWFITHANEPMSNIYQLLDLLLRANHSAWIEAVLREHAHYDSMAKATGFAPDEYHHPTFKPVLKTDSF